MEMDKSERRKFARVEGKSLVQFQGENFQIYSNLSNIGEGGLFVNTYFMLDEGEKVAVKFDLPKMKKTIDARGKVVRQIDDSGEAGRTPVGLGIAFESLNEDDRVAIKDYISALETF